MKEPREILAEKTEYLSDEKILVFTATYNEADNIGNLVRKIFEYIPNQHVLVVDDASPDGTGQILDKLSETYSNLHVIHRPAKLGLGTAHTLAMKYAVYNGFDILITMDADFSHNPKYIPIILEHLSENDFVIGSRYTEGGRSGYGFARTMISQTANILSQKLLNIPLKECTTSFRGFRVSMLKNFNIDAIQSEGYAFFFETVFYISLLTDKLAEFPIYFEDRRAGTSKISKREIFRAMRRLIKLLYRKVFFYDLLKNKVRQKLHQSTTRCIVCGGEYHKEIYPSNSHNSGNEKVFRCTSYGHNSHERIMVCLKCGLIFSDTQMQPEAIYQMYSSVEDQVYIENIGARYRTFRYNWSKIQNHLPSKGRLLDIGTYCGAFLKVAQEFGFEAMGIEPSEWAVKYSKNIMGYNVIQGTIADLPEEIGNFDVITLWDVLEHFSNPLDELSLIYNRLKPGGIVAFSTLDIKNWFPKIMGEHWPWLMDMHLFYFNKNVIENMLAKSGFKLIHSQSYCHIITVDYFLSKLDSLGIWGAEYFRQLLLKTPFKKFFIPFRFGDIQLYVAQKI